MLTTTAFPSVSDVPVSVQNETGTRAGGPSDFEIMQRVRAIRASWSASERVNRRHEAQRRYADLLEALCSESHAA